ncbi:hypothetical protein RJ639_031955 [Escallonia herrerae]|uniref:Germin-like protein n=1 Tax=Escallonia herrerae TaxID=1293975 RepID=A0AA88X049_9ASTE|nr:hypothetical protein RJ639_031955 [Escallonia herrerae]
MGVSMELAELAPGAVNRPHTHPRGSELLFVLEGALSVGTTDSRGKLYKNDLHKYDVFLFPEELPHYEANLNKAEVLMKTFKVSAETIQELKDA